VNEAIARHHSEVRDLKERLSRSFDDLERLRLELSASRQKAEDNKPAYEEVSERMGQILKLADDEARAQKARALDEIAKLRADAKQETDRFKAEAREQTERMLAAAQEQAENAIASARAEAEKTRSSARADSDHAISEAQKKSENAVAAAKAQAKQMLDEATARATAIHDGAERRLNLLVARHTETLRRLTEVRDVVTNLVAGEAARGSLEDEVARSVASAISSSGGATPAAASRPAAAAEGRHAPSAPAAPTPPPAAPPAAARPGVRSATLSEDRPKAQAADRSAGLDSGNGVAEAVASPARATHRVSSAPGDRTERTERTVEQRSAKAADTPVPPRAAAADPAETAD
jgi:hypothetical protein